jgi:hypothetical protein
MKKCNFHSLVFSSLLLVGAPTACNASQVSGIYVAHAPTVAEMLQFAASTQSFLVTIFVYSPGVPRQPTAALDGTRKRTASR